MPELTLASFNVHWGRGSRKDGWPEFDVAAACESFHADVIVLQELWGPDGGVAQHDAVADALGMRAVAVPMARATLEPKPKLLARWSEDETVGQGSWSLAVLTRKPIRASRVVPLPQLPLDPWKRCLLHVDIDVDGTNLAVVATHFAHLEFGSPLLTGALRRGLPPSDRPAVLVGDMNMWGWTVAAMTPRSWQRGVRGKTWPAPNARHQIDHLLVTPSVEVVRSEVLPHQGSDHLPDPSSAARAVSHPVVFLCTGNAARSVMGGAALAAHLPDWHVTTAGTLVVEGQPMSWRTKAALDSVGLAAPSHRSRQATDAELGHASLVIALAPEHVHWVRRTHPEAASRTATLRRLARDLPDHDAPLADRVASLDLAGVELGDWEEVVDPGGGDAPEFAACAAEVVELVAVLAPRLVGR